MYVNHDIYIYKRKILNYILNIIEIQKIKFSNITKTFCVN